MRDVIDDPLQGFGYNTIAAFNTCLHKPYRKPTKTLGKILNLTLKKPCKNYIIVKYLVGVADVLQVILDDVWYPHQKLVMDLEHGNIIDPRPGRFLTTNITLW